MRILVPACLLLVAILGAGCNGASEPVSPPEVLEPSSMIKNSTKSEPVSLPEVLESECSADQDCRIDGCSGQLCLPAGAPGIVTTCEYKPEYACLKLTSCGCVSGSCAWRPSEDYDLCMADLRSRQPE